MPQKASYCVSLVDHEGPHLSRTLRRVLSSINRCSSLRADGSNHQMRRICIGTTAALPQ
jgi:hypothetical protein